ncbi:unnamed protein product [Closterium sp. Naga37s-1]|nr:unnamed protein product [Closterium sp. Naga37s-1]
MSTYAGDFCMKGRDRGTISLYHILTNLWPYYITLPASTSSQRWPPQARLSLGNKQSYLGETPLGGYTATTNHLWWTAGQQLLLGSLPPRSKSALPLPFQGTPVMCPSASNSSASTISSHACSLPIQNFRSCLMA